MHVQCPPSLSVVQTQSQCSAARFRWVGPADLSRRRRWSRAVWGRTAQAAWPGSRFRAPQDQLLTSAHPWEAPQASPALHAQLTQVSTRVWLVGSFAHYKAAVCGTSAHGTSLGAALGVTSAACAYPCVKHFSRSLGHAASLYVESKILLSRHPQNVLWASPALRAYITSWTLQLRSQAVRGMDHASICIKQALQGCQACMSQQALTRLQGLAASRVSLFLQEHSWACEA